MRRAAISEVAGLLATRKLTGVVEVFGYTDNTGSDPGNLELSQARAQSVVDAPQKQAAVAGTAFQARGLGSADPVADNAIREKRARNRRVTILLPSS